MQLDDDMSIDHLKRDYLYRGKGHILIPLGAIVNRCCCTIRRKDSSHMIVCISF